MMIRAGASERTRGRLLFAAVALVILQVAAVSHLTGHSATGDNAGCAICIAASQSGSAVPAAPAALPVFHSITSLVVEPVARPVSARVSASYRARAPPVSV